LCSLNNLFPYKTVVKMESPLDPNVINDFFVHISQPCPNDEHSYLLPLIPYSVSSVQIPKWNLSTMYTSDTVKAWKKIKKHNSLTTDTLNICPKMIDLCMKSVPFQANLTNTFNQFISFKTIPDPLKKSRIVPIHKVRNPSSSEFFSLYFLFANDY
jgi:hypothetical protein